MAGGDGAGSGRQQYAMNARASLVPGGRLGRYELLEELGRGGMGLVFKARDPVIGRLVAIKTLHLELLAATGYRAEAEARFAREAQAIGRLSHRHIVTLFDAQQDGSLLYLVMELVKGQSLEALLRAGVAFPMEQVCAIGIQACEALDHAHGCGIIHRDIKPENMLLQDNGELKIADFGIAYLAMSALTRPGESIGTPSYMSPEQIEGKTVDGRSDLFSLGAVLYELCGGQKAFGAETISTVIYRILHMEPPPLQDRNALVPSLLDATIRKALAKAPGARYASAREFREALARAATALPRPVAAGVPAAGEADPTPAPAVQPPARRRWLPLAGIATAAALGLAAVLWLPRAPVSVPGVPEPGATAPADITPGTSAPAAVPAAPPPAPSAARAPAAIRVTFARDIKGMLPVDEVETFYRDDRQVILWIRWANVRGKHRVRTRWFDADGRLVHASPRPEPFDAPADVWTTWTALPLRRSMAGKSPGRWRAEVQVDNQTVVVASFSVVNQRRRAEP